MNTLYHANYRCTIENDAMRDDDDNNFKLLIHDLDDFSAKGLLPGTGEGIRVFGAHSARGCVGCFDCWIKTPGRCFLDDSMRPLPELLSKCEGLILISELVYGGYSPDMKAALDRLIPAMLPFFEIVEGKSAHMPRGRVSPLGNITNYFYRYENTGGISIEGKNNNSLKSLAREYLEASENLLPEGEAELMKRVAAATADNFRAKSHEVIFIGDKMNLSEVEL